MALWTREVEPDPDAYQFEIRDAGIDGPLTPGAWHPQTLATARAVGLAVAPEVLADLAEKPDAVADSTYDPTSDDLGDQIRAAVAAKLYPAGKTAVWPTPLQPTAVGPAERPAAAAPVEVPAPVEPAVRRAPAAPTVFTPTPQRLSRRSDYLAQLVRPARAAGEWQPTRTPLLLDGTTITGVGLTAAGKTTREVGRAAVLITNDGTAVSAHRDAYGRNATVSSAAMETWAAGLLDEHEIDALAEQVNGYDTLSLLYKRAKAVSPALSGYGTAAQPNKKVWGVPLGLDVANPDMLLAEDGTLFVLRTDVTTGKRVIRTTISFDRAEQFASAALAAEQHTAA